MSRGSSLSRVLSIFADMQQNGGEGTGRLHGQPDDLSSQKMSAMDVDMGRHPVPPGLNPRKVVSRALGATVPWLFGIALFTYVDRCAPAATVGRRAW